MNAQIEMTEWLILLHSVCVSVCAWFSIVTVNEWGHCKPIRKLHFQQDVKYIQVDTHTHTHTHTHIHTHTTNQSTNQKHTVLMAALISGGDNYSVTDGTLNCKYIHNHLGEEGWKWMFESRRWMFQDNWIPATGIHWEMFVQVVFKVLLIEG